ncbi:YqxA family protein [Metabacillus halosaccharovorans]|uniref:YqxA family protein n=1 Tax=Metabacillus halosaccharovorans TaxID=930124 RepID=A0ABT3DCX4_9BACI|nr:YqxA family protein [Metabacillus halosaccharovorans]MCV9884915.1 YqxA family protein [Metabacillus halosaccharovorans]
MVKFFLKCIVLCSVLLFGVLIGMQQANQGMIKMKGYNDPDFQGAFQIDSNETGDVEASILGNEVTSQDLQKKQEQLEQIEAFNIFSQLGKQFANIVSSGVSSLLKIVTELMDG